MRAEDIVFADLRVKHPGDVDPGLLTDFYRLAFKEREKNLSQNYSWLYRLSRPDQSGLVLILYHDQIIGHLGAIPFKMKIGEATITANFLVDVMILPEFRKVGAGVLGMEYYMRTSDLSISVRANEKAKDTLLKMGYRQSGQTYLHSIFIRPFSHPSFTGKLPVPVRKILDRIVYPLLHINYKRFSRSLKQKEFMIPDEDSLKRFSDIHKEYRMTEKGSRVSVVRDMDYLTWRILGSPDKVKYRVVEMKDFMAVIKLNESYIDILCVPDGSESGPILCFIAGLATWGGKNGYSYIRFYTSDSKLSLFLKRKLFSFVSNPLFSYYSPDAELMDRVNRMTWDLQLIDSDFEKF